MIKKQCVYQFLRRNVYTTLLSKLRGLQITEPQGFNSLFNMSHSKDNLNSYSTVLGTCSVEIFFGTKFIKFKT